MIDEYDGSDDEELRTVTVVTRRVPDSEEVA